MRASILSIFESAISGATPSMPEFRARLRAAAAEPGHAPLDFYHLLGQAVYRDSPAMIEALANAGADLNHAPEVRLTPLALAIQSGSLSAFHALLNAGADPEGLIAAGCPRCFENALALRRSEFALALIEAGMDIQRPDEHGRAPLFHAVYHNDETTLAALLARGADPLADHGSGSPLELASSQRRERCARAIAAFLEAQALADSLPRSTPARAPAL